MENVILIAVLLLIAGGAAYYVYRAKKNGAHCIGCPSGKSCGGSCHGNCDCGCGSCDSDHSAASEDSSND